MIETNKLENIMSSKKSKRRPVEAGLTEKEKKRPKKRKKAKELVEGLDYHVHLETSNPSFLKMYKILKDLGVYNNKFHLALLDPSLKNVNPFSPNLTIEQKARIIAECKKNFWYFLRECCRVATPGSGIGPGKGKKYGLHRGNLAVNYCIVNNINQYTEMPRQSGKSISVDAGLLWLLNFGTNTSKMLMMNKDHDGAKDNILRMQEMRDCLPEFLQGTKVFNDSGKELKPSANKEYIECKKTNNRVDTKASPTDPNKADGCGRGLTTPVQWIDEFALILVPSYREICRITSLIAGRLSPKWIC